ncbi:hypothetical protein Q6D67_10690 [Haliea sp. E1-2-M8]|uniref:hypothetical protein n=1 Tax=Haliea sp. E1-2-M8 TaxID=3064706 RepID=UPI00271D86BE|nr:hypothetical protein [Haliea sp. E1-2-M8]MDO8862169.1 hypothetical protein [Haliea sp. E1-2-M8]
MSTLRELHKLACLDSLGLQLLVARKPLPGAAPSAPRAVVARRTAVERAAVPAERAQPPASSPTAISPAAVVSGSAGAADSPVPRPEASREAPAPAPANRAQAAARAPDPGIPRFHLAAVVAGGCLWLEPLAGPELEQEPLKLIRAMAFALQRKQESPQVTRFDWPLHSNRQLDLSAAAAAAALTGFVVRQVQDRQCRALVLLGQAAGEHLLQPELDGVPIVLLPATGELLASPQRKREAWQALAALGN